MFDYCSKRLEIPVLLNYATHRLNGFSSLQTRILVTFIQLFPPEHSAIISLALTTCNFEIMLTLFFNEEAVLPDLLLYQ